MELKTINSVCTCSTCPVTRQAPKRTGEPGQYGAPNKEKPSAFLLSHLPNERIIILHPTY